MVTQQDVIKEFMKFLDSTDKSGITAVNLAIKKASNGKYNSISDVENEFYSNLVKTLKKNDTIYTGESIDEFLTKYCGIILGNADTGAITGKDANGSSVEKNKYDIIPENTSPIDIVQWYIKANIPDIISSEIFLNKFKDSTLKIVPHNGNKDTQIDLKFTRNGLTIIVPNYNQILKKANEGNEEALLKLACINGLYSWWIEESLKLIKQSFDYEFDSNTTVQEITLQFFMVVLLPLQHILIGGIFLAIWSMNCLESQNN